MVSFSQDIFQILQDHQRIILKDIGEILVISQNARFNKSKGVLEPPKGALKFNAKIKYFDTTVVNFYKKRYPDINETELEESLHAQLGEIADLLNSKGYYDIPKVGTLLMSNNKISLKENLEEEILRENFGLTEIELDEPKMVKQASATSNNSYTWLVVLTLLILVLAASVVFFTPQIKSVIENKGIGEIKIKSAGNDDYAIRLGIVNDSTVDVEGTNKETVIKNEKDILSNKLEQESNIKKALFYEEKPNSYSGFSDFYIIAGSFGIKENAILLQQELIKKGYKSEILETDDNKYRVTLQHYKNRAQAISDLRMYRTVLSELDIWLLSI